LHCLDGQTYPLFTIRVLEFELQLSYTVVNAVDLLQFLLMVQNMPVVTASQTNDCLGLSPICYQRRLVFPMAVSCSCPRHVSEWNLSSHLEAVVVWAGISRKLSQAVLYNASSVGMNISHAHDTWPRDVAIILQLRPKTARGSTDVRMCYRSRFGGAGCVSRVWCHDVADRKWQNDMGQVN